MKDSSSMQDKNTIKQAKQVLSGKGKKGLGRLLPFMGPAFIASVAYIDPGNYATNISSGAQFGYKLLWVVILSNMMAMLIQALSAKLGIATGRNLAEQCRIHFPKPVVYFMWVVMELAAMATDLAEFLGAALGFNLLFGIPLWLAGLLTAAATFIILGLERYGFRPLEAVISAMVGIVAVCYVIETFLDTPVWKDVLFHAVVPEFQGPESVLLATGIIGATIMPHAIYLHSALTQGRIVVRNPVHMKRLFRFEIYDVLIALTAASLINCAMLVMSASTFNLQGLKNIGTIQEAYRTLQPLLGPAAGVVFAISLLASGLASASVGTMAGQVIMQGFLHREIPVWVRRLVTMIPSLIVILLGLDPTRTLVISQVGLSFGLPFAIIPLVMFTSRRQLMGELTNHKLTTILAIMIACLIVALNIYLVYSMLFLGG
jgi:manganese transport protein